MYSFWNLTKQRGHLSVTLEIKMAVGPALLVGLLQALVVLDGDQRVLKPVAVRRVIVDVVGGANRHSALPNQLH